VVFIVVVKVSEQKFKIMPWEKQSKVAILMVVVVVIVLLC
jgi:hypothetical protein